MSNPNNRKDWFLKHSSNVDPVLFNIYNGSWLRDSKRENQINNGILSRNLLNVNKNPCNNIVDVESKLRNIDQKNNKYRCNT